ncbi:hypothetical protein B4N84_00105, partial [Flavobacterium sp. IR1]
MEYVEITAEEYQELVKYRRASILDAYKLSDEDRQTIEELVAYYTSKEDIERVVAESVERLQVKDK